MKPSRTAIALAITAALTSTPALIASAQVQVATAATNTLVGHVKEASRGVALEGARVSLEGRTIQTESMGNFRLSGVSAGQHTLVVDFLGYRRQEVPVTVGGNGATVLVTMTSTTARDGITTLGSVDVRGQREAQAMALNQQRTSTNYINVVSSDLLGSFPDNNIAESTQRIPGVSIERDQGEGRYVTVRGAPKEFTTVSIDGVQLANPDSASRGVELDTIPSDVIAALEVTKALTADMDGDAIAGNINIRTQSAQDHDGMILRASAAVGRFQLADGDNQRHKATFGNRFGKDGNLGLLVSASYSKQGRNTDNVETLYDASSSRILPTEVQIKDYQGTRTRTGINARFDLRIDSDNLLYLLASDARFKDHEFRDNLIVAMDQHTATSNETTGNVRATFDKELRERTYNKNIRTFGLGGEHYIGDSWRLDWQASSSKASKETDPRNQYIFRSSVRPKMNYDYTNPDFPVWAIQGRADAPATGVNLPESWFGFRRFNDRYEYGEEKETGLRVDARRDQSFLGEEGQIKVGLRTRMRDKSFNDERYRNGSAADFAKLGIKMSDMLCSDLGPSDNFDYFLTGGRFCRDIFAKYTGPLTNSPNFVRLVQDSMVGDYSASEDVQAAYARLDAVWGDLTLVSGLRYEHTQTDGNANLFDIKTNTLLPQHASRSYGDLLPSLHIRQEFDQDSILRASYSTALNRPDFIHTAPYRIVDEDEHTISEGNPNAKEAYAHNFDISYERYLRPLGLLSAALFYKKINDPLFVATSVTNGYKLTRAENGSSGNIHGLELAWQQTLDFLPAPLDGFGVYANYTYAKSEANLPFGIGKTELPGTSRTNYNAALSYEKYGISARLSYNYRSKFIQTFDITNPSLNVYWDGRSSVDFSASYALAKQWRVFGEMNNITNTRQIRFQGQRNRVLEMEGFGRSWLLGVRYEL